MGKPLPPNMPDKIEFIAERSSEYKLEFINGAVCNITARGEIVCDFHLESRDRPTGQIATISEDGTATFSEFQETGRYSRDVKFGIVMNSSFAKDLVKLLNTKIKEADEIVTERAKRRTKK